MKPAQERQRKPRPNLVYELFAKHLTELNCTFWRECRVIPDRKFAWDFVFIQRWQPWNVKRGWAVEIDGYHNGRHGAGWGSDNEKMNLATVHGWRFLRFSTTQVKNGQAKEFIRVNLLGGEL